MDAVQRQRLRLRLRLQKMMGELVDRTKTLTTVFDFARRIRDA